jgi:6-pyruvoyltetrahydropterin/6-carboxytetrahydropterin synthase
MYELTKQFRFEAAHTLNRTVQTESSRRIHGHSYRAEITIRGTPDANSGMIIDLTLFENILEDVRDRLDHHFLDEINDLGPATLENLAFWIWNRLEGRLPGLFLVTVLRDSNGERCSYSKQIAEKSAA